MLAGGLKAHTATSGACLTWQGTFTAHFSCSLLPWFSSSELPQIQSTCPTDLDGSADLNVSKCTGVFLCITGPLTAALSCASFFYRILRMQWLCLCNGNIPCLCDCSLRCCIRMRCSLGMLSAQWVLCFAGARILGLGGYRRGDHLQVQYITQSRAHAGIRRSCYVSILCEVESGPARDFPFLLGRLYCQALAH